MKKKINESKKLERVLESCGLLENKINEEEPSKIVAVYSQKIKSELTTIQQKIPAFIKTLDDLVNDINNKDKNSAEKNYNLILSFTSDVGKLAESIRVDRAVLADGLAKVYFGTKN